MKMNSSDARRHARRHNRLEIKLSDEELSVIEQKAKNAKLSKSAYLRRMGTVGEISKEIFYLKSELIDKLDGLCKEKNYAYVEDMEQSCYRSDWYFAHPLIDNTHAMTKSECSKKYAWTLPMTPEAAVREYEHVNE